MTARRVQVTQERIVQVDDTNELKCGDRCQFLKNAPWLIGNYCFLSGMSERVNDRNRTEACTSGDVRAMGGGK